MSVAKGTWVEIESVVLKPEERAPGLPEDTAATPYTRPSSIERPFSARRSNFEPDETTVVTPSLPKK